MITHKFQMVMHNTSGDEYAVLHRFVGGDVNFVIIEGLKYGRVSAFPEQLVTSLDYDLELSKLGGKFKYEIGEPLSVIGMLPHETSLDKDAIGFINSRMPVARAHSTKGVAYYACVDMFGATAAIAERWLRPKYGAAE